MSKSFGKRRIAVLIVLIALALLLAGCRNETQNRLRRNIQDFTNARMYITLYSLDGQEIYNGVVDGKVTRSSAQSASGGSEAAGSYIFWYDEQGNYHQTDMPYLVTEHDRNGTAE